MTETGTDHETKMEGWMPWRVAPDSGFVVDDPRGSVELIQLNDKNFCIENEFRFSDDAIEQDLIDKIVAAGVDATRARQMVDDARTFTPAAENPSDLASIPRFMRWFENPYGRHTLAAILHDELIVTEVNGGALGSDALADRFFRRMMGSAGVPWLKRWIMWAAVALRSRGGRRPPGDGAAVGGARGDRDLIVRCSGRRDRLRLADSIRHDAAVGRGLRAAAGFVHVAPSAPSVTVTVGV